VGEQGLLSIAFHLNFENNGYFFVYYTNTAGDIRLTRFRTVGGNPNNNADESSGVVLMTIPHPVNGNHNGGKLNFGPDGNLYFGTGDGGGTGDPTNNAQNANSLLGKMIRINVDNFSTLLIQFLPIILIQLIPL
jgi:glucose/arabinose dehydrogenase